MLNLYNLKYFYDSCRLSSMSAAAEVNFVSRPAISQGIKKLEEQVGVSLLEHRQRKLLPTQEGLLLMNKAAEIFMQVENANALLKSTNRSLSGYFVIGTIRSLATHNLDTVVADLKKNNPDLKIQIKIGISTEVVELLADRKIDVALFLGDERLPNCEQVVVKKGQFKLIKPLRKPERETAFAITEKRPETNRLKSLYERRFRKPLPIFGEIPSWDAIMNWVDNGTCGGLVPDFILPHASRKFEVVLDDVHRYEMKAMFQNSRLQDRGINEFIESVKRALATKI